LSDELRVIAVDPRGHGESDKPETGYNYHTLARDLDALLTQLDLRDVTLLGHSGGCKIILTYWEIYGGDRVRSIVFSDDSPCHLVDGIFTAEEALAAIEAFEGPDAVEYSRGFSDQFLSDEADEATRQLFQAEALKLPRPYMAKLFRWAAFGDWWDAFRLVDVPCLVFGGRASKVPLHVVQKIADSLPGSELVLFEVEEHGAHAMFFECPTKYNEAIRRFMAN
jgi:pimeloyl-ACP methyl ester carboxylesterase